MLGDQLWNYSVFWAYPYSISSAMVSKPEMRTGTGSPDGGSLSDGGSLLSAADL